ncbi:DUF1491 family protein [Emcibacter sp.]|uniref:DUF1491 family protein n=1 Tax=Emcibacter sp. TaxID=1979954 RepID=UPI002AA6DE33|nr:DUF1491 family protein [Emcibacter sp.]
MFEERLKTSIWVSAEIRRLDVELISAMVLHKGDADRGLVLIKQNLFGPGCILYTQARDLDGVMVWRCPLGDDPVPEDKADTYIARQRDYDEDLWVIEVEDPKGIYRPQG